MHIRHSERDREQICSSNCILGEIRYIVLHVNGIKLSKNRVQTVISWICMKEKQKSCVKIINCVCVFHFTVLLKAQPSLCFSFGRTGRTRDKRY